MRVLFLAPQMPYPARSGASIRNLHLIKGLALRHEVTLLSFGEPGVGYSGPLAAAGPEYDEARSGLSSCCRAVEIVARPARSRWRRLAELPGPRPDLVRRLSSPALAARARALVARERFDVVHVGGLELAEVGLSLGGPAALILDEHNAEYVLQRRAFENECRLGGNPAGALYSLLQWAKLQRYEGRALRLADGVMAVSEVDRLALRRVAPTARVAVVPNSVDVEEYRPVPAPAGNPTLVFTGKMDFRPNVDAVVWFCREVFPLVRAKLPDARFQIVGRDPTPAIRRLGDLPGVTVVGPVPDDRPYIGGAGVFVVPMRVGGGARLKVLQAMAMRVPIVATTVGYEGIAARPGEHLLAADSPPDFARAVLHLLASPAQVDSLTRAGRELVERRYDWRVLASPLHDFYASTVAARRGGHRGAS